MNASALTAVLVASAREKLRSPGEAMGSAFFLAVLLFIFTRLWTVLGDAAPLPVAHLVAYLLVAEIVVMAPGTIAQRLGREVRSGDIGMHLLRPVNHAAWEIARAWGAAIARAAVLLVAGATVLLITAGLPRLPLSGVLAAAALVPLALVGECAGRVVLGVLAFWTEDAAPFAFIWNKLAFLLGGLLMPIQFYPPALQAVARWLPFEAFVGGPASVLVDFDPARAAGVAARLAVWTLLLVSAALLIHARAVRAVQAGGG